MATGLTPVMIRLARRLGFVDHPAGRKIHARPVPLGGGVALAAAAAGGVAAGVWAGKGPDLDPGFLASAAGGFLVAFAVGLIDDRRPLAPAVKLGGQLEAAAILVLGSGRPDLEAVGGFAVPVAIVSLAALMNACNFLDNMDGILSGVGLVCAAGLLAIAVQSGSPLALVAASTAGAAAGFLAYNFAPARIFMGDAGSLTLGFLLGAIALGLAPETPAGPQAIGILLVLGYPVFDFAFVNLTRLRDRRPVWVAGKDHSTHRLHRLVASPRRTALAVYGLAAMSAAAGVAVAEHPGTGSALFALGGGAVLTGLGIRLARVPFA